MVSLSCKIAAYTCLCITLVQARIYPTRFPNVTWDDYNWRLQTQICDQGHYQARGSLANGYFGINVAALGPFFEVDTPVNNDLLNGWPLFARRQTFGTVAGFWNSQPTTNMTNFEWLNQYGGESVISGLPHLSGLVPTCKGQALDASTDLSQISGFSSTFDYKFGTLSWRYTWTPPECQAFEIEYQMFVHKLYVHQAAVQLKITPSRDANITVYDVLDGDAAVRTDFKEKGFDSAAASIWSAVTPTSLKNVSAYVYSTLGGDKSVDFSTLKLSSEGKFVGKNQSSIAQSVKARLRAGRTTRIRKFIGIASSDAIEDPQQAAQDASAAGAKMGYFDLLDAHMKEWRTLMPSDSVDRYQDPSTSELIDDPNAVEHQILAVVNPFYILQNTIGQNAIAEANGNRNLNKYSIAVGGLTSDSYAGMVFWDADVWMQPGVVLSHPDAMRQVADYRLDRRDQALANVKTAYQSSQKNTKFSPNSAVYSWTSGRWGNCTGTGPCFDYEYHLNGAISLQVENYWLATGDTKTFKKDYFQIYDSAAHLFSDLLKLNEKTGTYMLSNATDPDEFANMIDNPGYTMILMQTILNRANQYRKQLGMSTKAEWTRQANNIEIPISKKAGIHLEYEGMDGRIEVKQADVVLIYDFLHYKSKYAEGDLAFYAGKQSQAGPAMTYGVFSIVEAEEAPSGCSFYTYDLYGTQPYIRGPWFQFSEQLVDNFDVNGGFHPAYPFLTGMGGANRVAPYGYLGLRLQPASLDINPTLPPQIPYLNLRTIHWQGYAIKAVLNQTHTTITRLPNSRALPNANPDYANAGIPVNVRPSNAQHMLSPGSTLTLNTRLPGNIKTTAGNVAQCRPVPTTDQDIIPGQFPLAAVDGSLSTKWQPVLARRPASIIVSLGQGGVVPISGFAFDWGQAPPDSYSVHFSNSSNPSSGDLKLVASSDNVRVSKPYDPSQQAIRAVVPYSSNTTTVNLPKAVMGAKYAVLTIQGTQALGGKDAPGATVAEWAIIAQSGAKMDAKLVRRTID